MYFLNTIIIIIFLQNFWLKDFEDGSSFFAFLNHSEINIHLFKYL